jgi:hypothetical protein
MKTLFFAIFLILFIIEYFVPFNEIYSDLKEEYALRLIFLFAAYICCVISFCSAGSMMIFDEFEPPTIVNVIRIISVLILIFPIYYWIDYYNHDNIEDMIMNLRGIHKLITKYIFCLVSAQLFLVYASSEEQR